MGRPAILHAVRGGGLWSQAAIYITVASTPFPSQTAQLWIHIFKAAFGSD
jgi:hypothetical protein